MNAYLISMDGRSGAAASIVEATAARGGDRVRMAFGAADPVALREALGG